MRIRGNKRLSLMNSPDSASSAGLFGQVATDGSYWYVCSAANTWVRTSLVTWSPFSPASISGLQLWLDGSDASTLYDATTGGSLVAADGGVARWEDKSGNARHATQATSSNRPARKTAIQGGRDVLRFDGSNDSLSIPSSTETFKFLHSADSTVFAVFKSGTTANPGHSYYAILYTHSSESTQVGYGFGTYDASPSNDTLDFGVSRGVGSTSAVYIEANNGFPSNVFGVASFVTKPTDGVASNRGSYRRNGGSAVTSNTSTNAVSTANSQANLTIGNVAATHSLFLNGDIAEIIIYDTALSDTDRANVESYLMQKWAITPAPVPQTIAGLQLWLDASDASSLYDATSGGSLAAADGGVARWEDKSGNARHATQGTSGNRPARKTAIQGGKDVLRFDGSGDSLSIGDAETFKFLHSANSTVFIALTRSSNSGSAIMCTNNGGTGTVGWSSYFFDGTSTNDRFGMLVGSGQLGVAVSQVNSGNGVISSGWSVLSFVSKPTDATAGNRASLRQNGGTAIADNAATGTASTSNSQGAFIIGAFVGFAADYGGDIAEIIIYDAALSDTDRAAVEGYLMTKWGIT